MEKRVTINFLVFLLSTVIFVAANYYRVPGATKHSELSVVIPVPMQLMVSLGDRYLAANFAVWRTLMVGTDALPPETLAAQAKVQEDASFLNPAHEDNYVMATALLPWEGYVAQTQNILRRATVSRKSDFYAPFFYGFNQIHFLNDPIGASEYGRIALSRAPDEQTRQAMAYISAAWLERSNDPLLSIGVIRALAQNVRDPGLSAHLMLRVKRQERLAQLQDLVSIYKAQFGHLPDRLELLGAVGMTDEMKSDPLGAVEFFLDSYGGVRFFTKKQ
jgi:hypothetical protein